MANWDRFDTIATPEEVNEAKNKYSPLEAGRYVAKLEEINPAESQNGLPMLKGKFRTLENRVVFYNQNLQNLSNPQLTAVNIAEAVEFISKALDEEVVFEGLAKFEDTVKSVTLGGLYQISVTYGKKDEAMKYPKVKIIAKVKEEVPFDV